MKISKIALMIGATTVVVGLLSATSASGKPNDAPDREVTFIVDDAAMTLREVGTARSALAAEGDNFLVKMRVSSNDVINERQIELVRHPNASDTRNPATYVASTTGRVTLTWSAPEGSSIEWEISRDGRPIGTTRETTFTDDRPPGQGISEYRIEGFREVLVDGKTATEPFLVVLDVPHVDSSSIGDRLNTESRTVDKNEDVLRAQAAQVTTINQQLNTFIPDYAINGPWNVPACLQAWSLQPGTLLRFAGDNRTFAGPNDSNPSVRTQIWATYNITDGAPYPITSFGTKTSGTRLIDTNGNTVVQNRTNLSGIQRVGDAGDPVSVRSTWEHGATDPLCAFADPIDYRLTFGSTQNGYVTLRGWHEQAPSYEFRTRWGANGLTGPWKNVYTASNKGFEYLFAAMPKANVDIYRLVTPF